MKNSTLLATSRWRRFGRLSAHEKIVHEKLNTFIYSWPVQKWTTLRVWKVSAGRNCGKNDVFIYGVSNSVTSFWCYLTVDLALPHFVSAIILQRSTFKTTSLPLIECRQTGLLCNFLKTMNRYVCPYSPNEYSLKNRGRQWCRLFNLFITMHLYSRRVMIVDKNIRVCFKSLLRWKF